MQHDCIRALGLNAVACNHSSTEGQLHTRTRARAHTHTHTHTHTHMIVLSFSLCICLSVSFLSLCVYIYIIMYRRSASMLCPSVLFVCLRLYVVHSVCLSLSVSDQPPTKQRSIKSSVCLSHRTTCTQRQVVCVNAGLSGQASACPRTQARGLNLAARRAELTDFKSPRPAVEP